MVLINSWLTGLAGLAGRAGLAWLAGLHWLAWLAWLVWLTGLAGDYSYIEFHSSPEVPGKIINFGANSNRGVMGAGGV